MPRPLPAAAAAVGCWRARATNPGSPLPPSPVARPAHSRVSARSNAVTRLPGPVSGRTSPSTCRSATRSASPLAYLISSLQIARRFLANAFEITRLAAHRIKCAPRCEFEAHGHENAACCGGSETKCATIAYQKVHLRIKPRRQTVGKRWFRRRDGRARPGAVPRLRRPASLRAHPTTRPRSPRNQIQRRPIARIASRATPGVQAINRHCGASARTPLMICSPDRCRYAVRSETAESGEASPRQSDQSAGPPMRQLLGGIRPIEAGIGEFTIARRPAGVGRVRAVVGSHLEPAWLALADQRVHGHAIQHDIEDEAKVVAPTFVDQRRDSRIGGRGCTKRRVQRLVIGGQEEIAAAAGFEQRRGGSVVEPHCTAA